MEKQIEEMARDICPYKDEYIDCKQCDTELDIGEYPCCYKGFAKQMYEKDYRKASDVAREIFAEIEENMTDIKMEFATMRAIGKRHFAKIKEKYEGGT